MHDVFTIVVPEADGKTLKEEAYNLYTEYATVTPDIVASSNKWYNSWPKGPTWQENFNWTYQFFKYNVATEVAEKTEEAVLALQVRLKKLNLKNIPGENADKAISLARAAILRLETFNKTPEGLVRNLLKSFQTTSVPSFNEVFRHMEKQHFLDQALGGGREKLNASGIFNVAAAQYRLLWEEGEWTGVRTQEEAILRIALVGTLAESVGSAGIQIINFDKMKEVYRKEKKAKQGNKDDGKKTKSNKPPSKWRPPVAEENNRRSINGKRMFWSGQKKKSVADRGTKSANAAATTSAAPPTPAPTVTPVVPTPVVPANQTAAVLTVRQAYANAFAAL